MDEIGRGGSWFYFTKKFDLSSLIRLQLVLIDEFDSAIPNYLFISPKVVYPDKLLQNTLLLINEVGLSFLRIRVEMVGEGGGAFEE